MTQIVGLALALVATGSVAQEPEKQLKTLNDVSAAMEECWVPPPLDQARPGMQITVLMTFRRNGELFGKPRITFESPGASDAERLAYRIAVAEMLKRCARLPFSEALGNAIAGQPFTMRFMDTRKLKQTENIS